MSDLAYRARCLGPLRVVDWVIPPGVSVVVGPNRVGKSTLLRVPEIIQLAVALGVNDAVKRVFDGVSSLRNWSLAPSTPINLGFRVGGIEWETELEVRNGNLADCPQEQLRRDSKPLIWRKSGSREIEGEGFQHSSPSHPIPAVVAGWGIQQHLGDVQITPEMRNAIPIGSPPSTGYLSVNESLDVVRGLASRSFRTYHYEVKHLLRFGSEQSSELRLLSTGENVFPLLRNWRDRPDYEDRYEFVLDTMRAIFPHLGRVGFEQAGQTVTMNVSDRRWPDGKTVPIARESTGFITALLQLCAVASCDPHGLVTLDEIETSLHPRAIRVLIEAMRSWAAKHELRIVLATQSETVLDQFRDDPSRVFVLEPKQERSPQALTELFSPEYLSQFSLGDLFAHLEFGADEPADS